MNWKRNLLMLAVSSALVACSGGGGGGSTGSSSASIGGTVAKGIVVGAVVRILSASGTELGTTTTDANGDYSFDLPSSYDGGPLRIEVVGTGGGTMKCDVATGCDHDGDSLTPVIPFGQTVNLTSNFKLESVVPGTTESSVSAPVTALTDMAAKLAKRNVGSGPLNADAIAVARSQVVNLFGLTENDLDAKPLDITDPAVIATATVEQLRSALYSAAILGAVLQSAPDDIGTALETFSTAFADAGGQLTLNDGQEGSDDPNVVSFDDVLEAAVAVANEGTISGAVSSLDDSLVTEISNTLASAATASIGSTTTSEPSPTAGSESLQQARAMIADLRDLAYALGTMQSGSISSDMQALVGGADAFETNLQIAGDATGPAAQYLLQGLGMAAAAMAEAAGVYAYTVFELEIEAPSIVPTGLGLMVGVSVPDSSSPYSIVLTVAKEGFDVDPDYIGTDGINLVDLDLSFTLSLSDLEALLGSLTETMGVDENGNPTQTATASGDFNLDAALSGSVGSSAALLTLPPSSDERTSIVSVDINSISVAEQGSEPLLVTVDGSSADWSTSFMPWWHGAAALSDDKADSEGLAPEQNIEELWFRSSELQLAFALKLAGNPVYPHTTGVDDARYEVVMQMYDDDACAVPHATTDDLTVPWYRTARSRTRDGVTDARLYSFDANGDFLPLDTAAPEVNSGGLYNLLSANSGDVVELLVPRRYLPAEVGSILVNPRVRTLLGDTPTTLDDFGFTNCISLNDQQGFSQSAYETEIGFAPSAISLSLAASLAQQGVEQPASFEGHIGASVAGGALDLTESESTTLTEGSGEEQGTTTITESFADTAELRFATANMQFGGTFAQGDNSFEAQFTLDLNSNDFVASDSFSESWSTTYGADGLYLFDNWDYQYDSDMVGFITGTAVLSMDLTLDGLAYAPVGVQLTVARDSESTGGVDLRVDMGASKHVELAVELQEVISTSEGVDDDVVVTSATLTNQDGVTITLQNPDTTPSGVITKGSGSDQEELGTVSEGVGGSLLFRLRDGLETRIETL